VSKGYSKSVYRKKQLEWRLSLSESDWVEMSQKICAHLLLINQLTKASCVHVYWPMVAKREVDIRPVINVLYESGCEVLLPVIQGKTLKHASYTGPESLVPGPFGVFEPTLNHLVPAPQPEAILVPALAIDASGNRIGYGKGFYDGFLHGMKAVKIVPLFSRQVVEGIPNEPHDVPVDMVVTEHGQLPIVKSIPLVI